MSIRFDFMKGKINCMMQFSISGNPYNTTVIPNPVILVESETATLTCTSTGKPSPTVTWHVKDDMMNAIGNTSKYLIASSVEMTAPGDEYTTTSVLTITNASIADTGNYTCIAGGKLKNESDAARLTVQCE